MDDFKAYPKIEQIGKLYMTITQKIHGTNAQILIQDLTNLQDGSICSLKAGSRNRWLTPEDDNYGFAKWVWENTDELIKVLGPGIHYGEWCGKGINNGEGLSTKVFVLFDWWKYADREKFPFHPFISETLQIRTVPVLYTGPFSYEKIEEVMADLKANGSKLTPVNWFMKPEGVVIDINGQKFKKVFDPEDTKWNKSDAPRIQHTNVDVSHLLQPLRLEKLISKDERYRREYPENMKQIFTDYYQDLLTEGQIVIDQEDIDAIKKALGKELYRFIRHQMENGNADISI